MASNTAFCSYQRAVASLVVVICAIAPFAGAQVNLSQSSTVVVRVDNSSYPASVAAPTAPLPAFVYKIYTVESWRQLASLSAASTGPRPSRLTFWRDSFGYPGHSQDGALTLPYLRGSCGASIAASGGCSNKRTNFVAAECIILEPSAIWAWVPRMLTMVALLSSSMQILNLDARVRHPVSRSTSAVATALLVSQIAWKFTAAQYIVTVAGNGIGGYSGDGGRATSAEINSPFGIAVDVGGNVFVADTYNSRIRKVTPAGVISTFAGGNGNGVFTGDGGPATLAGMWGPTDVALDGHGNVYIADTGNSRIRLVSLNGVITTIAGSDNSGFSGDGGAATLAQLTGPMGIALDTNGNLYIADTGNGYIRVVYTNGTIDSIAGFGSNGYGGDGEPAIYAMFSEPYDVAVDGEGNVFVADMDNNRVRKILSNGIITTVAGDGLQGYNGDFMAATLAWLNNPTGIAVDSAGNLYIVDHSGHRVRLVTPGGIITSVAGNGICSYRGDGGPATLAELCYPSGIAVAGSGNLYIADLQNYRVRMVSQPTYSITPSCTLSGTFSPPPVSPMSTASRSLSSTPSASCTMTVLSPSVTPSQLCATSAVSLFPLVVMDGVYAAQPQLLASELACQRACCFVSACSGYTFNSEALLYAPLGACFLLANSTQLVPAPGRSSGVFLQRSSFAPDWSAGMSNGTYRGLLLIDALLRTASGTTLSTSSSSASVSSPESGTASVTGTPTASPAANSTSSRTGTATASPQGIGTLSTSASSPPSQLSLTLSLSGSGSASVTVIASPLQTGTSPASAVGTHSRTPNLTYTKSLTSSRSFSKSKPATGSRTRTKPKTPTPSHSPSRSHSVSRSRSPSMPHKIVASVTSTRKPKS